MFDFRFAERFANVFTEFLNAEHKKCAHEPTNVEYVSYDFCKKKIKAFTSISAYRS